MRHITHGGTAPAWVVTDPTILGVRRAAMPLEAPGLMFVSSPDVSVDEDAGPLKLARF